MPMLVPGTIVHYRPREGEAGAPGIIMSQWPDGSVQLHVYHFDTGTHIRSAHPVEFDVLLDPSQIAALIERNEQLERRLSDLEDLTESLAPLFLRLRNMGLDNNTGPQPDPDAVDSTPEVPAPAVSVGSQIEDPEPNKGEDNKPSPWSTKRRSKD